MLPRPQQRVHQHEHRLLGPRERQHALRRHAFVRRGDLAPQERVAGRLGVAEPEVAPHGARLVVGEREQLVERHRLHVRGAEQVPRGELVPREVALERELGEWETHHPRDGDHI